MSLSVDDVLALIDEQVSYLTPDRNAVAAVRRRGLLRLRGVLEESGFPTDRDRRRQLSLVPLIFQEANYDDIAWTDQAAPLGRLSRYFTIEFALQSSGRERHELTAAEYAECVRTWYAAIRRS